MSNLEFFFSSFGSSLLIVNIEAALADIGVSFYDGGLEGLGSGHRSS